MIAGIFAEVVTTLGLSDSRPNAAEPQQPDAASTPNSAAPQTRPGAQSPFSENARTLIFGETPAADPTPSPSQAQDKEQKD